MNNPSSGLETIGVMLRIILVVVVLMCNCGRQNFNLHVSDINIIGVWYQVETQFYNDSGHMAVANKWTFLETKCKVHIARSREYNYSVKDDKLYLKPIQGNVYDEWEHMVLFNGEFEITLNDSKMIWQKPHQHKIVFKRNI